MVRQELTPEYRKFYNACAKLWGQMMKEFEKMRDLILAKIDLHDFETRSIKRVMGQFWGTHQRFFNQLCLGAKVPAVVRLAKHALANNQCVVIGMQSTGESRTEAHIKEHGFQGQFLSNAKLFITHVVESMYKTGSGACSLSLSLPPPPPRALGGAPRPSGARLPRPSLGLTPLIRSLAVAACRIRDQAACSA